MPALRVANVAGGTSFAGKLLANTRAHTHTRVPNCAQRICVKRPGTAHASIFSPNPATHDEDEDDGDEAASVDDDDETVEQ